MIPHPFWVLGLFKNCQSTGIPRIRHILRSLPMTLRGLMDNTHPSPRVRRPRFWGFEARKLCLKAGALVLVPSESTTANDPSLLPPAPSHFLQLAGPQPKIACQLNWHHERFSGGFPGLEETAKFL